MEAASTAETPRGSNRCPCLLPVQWKAARRVAAACRTCSGNRFPPSPRTAQGSVACNQHWLRHRGELPPFPRPQESLPPARDDPPPATLPAPFWRWPLLRRYCLPSQIPLPCVRAPAEVLHAATNPAWPGRPGPPCPPLL